MKRIAAFLLLLLLLCTLCSCGGKPDGQLTQESADDPELKLVLNPLAGVCNLPAEQAGKRPFAVFIDNLVQERPQYGLSAADIILETETEGGITRYMALFANPSCTTKIGPVRSLRHIFVEGIVQWDPIIQNFGSSDYSVPLLREHGIRTIDVYFDTASVFVDEERRKDHAIEHCYFTNSELLETVVASMEMRDEWQPDGKTAFDFIETGVTLSGGEARRIAYRFSLEYTSPLENYGGLFSYDEATQRYVKCLQDGPILDAENGAALSFGNDLVLFAAFSRPLTGASMILDLDYSAGGEGYYFNEGRYERILWDKDDWEQNFVLTRADGRPLQLATGRTYLAMVNTERTDTLSIEG